MQGPFSMVEKDRQQTVFFYCLKSHIKFCCLFYVIFEVIKQEGKNMKPINQSKGFSVCLNGWTIPKYALYGNVYNTIFVCLNTAPENGGYKILVWHNATEKSPGDGRRKTPGTDTAQYTFVSEIF